MSSKGKRAGIGAGLFGGAGLFAAYGLGAIVAAAIFALAGPLPGWAAALIVAGGLFLIAGVSALIGKRELKQGTPPVPEQTGLARTTTLMPHIEVRRLPHRVHARL